MTPDLLEGFVLGLATSVAVISACATYVLARAAFATVPQPPPDETPLDEAKLRELMRQEDALRHLDKVDHHLQPYGLRMLRTGDKQ